MPNAQGQFDKDTNLPFNSGGIKTIRFGYNAPLLEVELNEMQYLVDRRIKNLMKAMYTDGVLESSNHTYLNGTLTLYDTEVFLDGEHIAIKSYATPLANEESLYLNIKAEVKDYSHTLRQDGYDKGAVLVNPCIDVRYGLETSRRVVLTYSLTKAPVAGSITFKVASVTSDVLTVYYLRSKAVKCPHIIGQMIVLVTEEHPENIWSGTKWTQVRDTMIRATKIGEKAGLTGGSDTVTLTASNMPVHTHTISISSSGGHTHTASHSHTASSSNHTHTVSGGGDHSHSIPAHTHEIYAGSGNGSGRNYIAIEATRSDGWKVTNKYGVQYIANGGAGTTGSSSSGSVSIASASTTISVGTTSLTTSAVADHTHTVSASNSGGGTAFSTVPKYYTAHHWIRTS